MSNRRTGRDVVTNLTIIAVFMLAVIIVSQHGESGRVYLEPTRVYIISQPQDALSVWEKAGVRGRILVLADRYLNAEILGTGLAPIEIPSPTKDNYMYVAFRKNIVREVYHVIPEQAWSEVEKRISTVPGAVRSGGGYRLVEWETPVLIMRAKDLPLIKEKVLLHIGGGQYNENDMHRITALLRSNSIRSDLVTLVGNLPKRLEREIIRYASGNSG